MMRPRFVYKAIFILLVVCFGCKSSEPAYDFVKPSDRTDWQSQIKSGEVGFYDVSEEVTANIDEPPKVKGKERFHEAVSISMACRQQARESRTKTVGKIEFLINKKGEASQFYILQDSGDCNEVLARSFKEAAFEPAMANGKPIPTLVHFSMLFRFVDQSRLQQRVN